MSDPETYAPELWTTIYHGTPSELETIAINLVGSVRRQHTRIRELEAGIGVAVRLLVDGWSDEARDALGSLLPDNPGRHRQ